MRTAVLAISALLLGLGICGAASSAESASAAYESRGTWGELSITGPGAGCFSVWGEQEDGTYAMVAGGRLPADGVAVLVVPQSGPIDDQPQFYVRVGSAGGETSILAIPDPATEWVWW